MSVCLAPIYKLNIIQCCQVYFAAHLNFAQFESRRNLRPLCKAQVFLRMKLPLQFEQLFTGESSSAPARLAAVAASAAAVADRVSSIVGRMLRPVAMMGRARVVGNRSWTRRFAVWTDWPTAVSTWTNVTRMQNSCWPLCAGMLVPCTLVKMCKRLGEIYCLHIPGWIV